MEYHYEIIKTSKRNKTEDLIDIRSYNKHRNYVEILNKKTKFGHSSEYDSNGNKQFWVNCKFCFTNKHSKADTDVMLVKMER